MLDRRTLKVEGRGRGRNQLVNRIVPVWGHRARIRFGSVGPVVGPNLVEQRRFPSIFVLKLSARVALLALGDMADMQHETT